MKKLLIIFTTLFMYNLASACDEATDMQYKLVKQLLANPEGMRNLIDSSIYRYSIKGQPAVTDSTIQFIDQLLQDKFTLEGSLSCSFVDTEVQNNVRTP